jgi:hypothetical protein
VNVTAIGAPRGRKVTEADLDRRQAERSHVIGMHGAMKPRRASGPPRNTRNSGAHPVDWILLAALVGLLAVAAAGWLR